METIEYEIYERIKLSDFIFELMSEEIPAKMQEPAMRQLENLTLRKVNENNSGLKKWSKKTNFR